MKHTTIALVFLLLIAVMQCGIAQTVQGVPGSKQAPDNSGQTQVYPLPFASSGNTIELTVANTANISLTNIRVDAAEVPSWLKFKSTEQHIALLKGQQETQALFTFAVDKMAPVQKNQTLKFVISGSTGEKWTKEIVVAVTPPEKFEVFQNFPNPFNPTTVISYQLSVVSKVSLKVYNMLGQEVATLIDGTRLAGYHQETWDAARYSSGAYVYQLIATDEKGAKQVAHKRMLLLK
jgi:hypothetical protein